MVLYFTRQRVSLFSCYLYSHQRREKVQRDIPQKSGYSIKNSRPRTRDKNSYTATPSARAFGTIVALTSPVWTSHHLLTGTPKIFFIPPVIAITSFQESRRPFRSVMPSGSSLLGHCRVGSQNTRANVPKMMMPMKTIKVRNNALLSVPSTDSPAHCFPPIARFPKQHPRTWLNPSGAPCSPL